MRKSYKFIVFLIGISISGCVSSGTGAVSNGANIQNLVDNFSEVKVTAKTLSDDPEPAVITIAAVGDMMIGSPYPTTDRMPPNDGKGMFDLVESVLSKADIAFGNLEGALLDSGESDKCKPESKVCYAFRMPTRYGKYFKDAGFDVVSVANNHAGDFGHVGRTSTRRVLDELEIKHAGINSGTLSTAYIEVKGKTIAFVAFATNSISLNLNELDDARAAIENADKKADVVVVSFHGGAEGDAAQHVPFATEMFYGEERGNLPEFARTVIDSGADLVLGHGPHVLRGMEVYKGRLIAYSLGNFATYGWFRLMGPSRLSAILEVEIDGTGQFVGGKIHSGKQKDWGIPALDPAGTAIRTIRNLSKADFKTNSPLIKPDGTISPSTK